MLDTQKTLGATLDLPGIRQEFESRENAMRFKGILDRHVADRAQSLYHDVLQLQDIKQVRDREPFNAICQFDDAKRATAFIWLCAGSAWLRRDARLFLDSSEDILAMMDSHDYMPSSNMAGKVARSHKLLARLIVAGVWPDAMKEYNGDMERIKKAKVRSQITARVDAIQLRHIIRLATEQGLEVAPRSEGDSDSLYGSLLIADIAAYEADVQRSFQIARGLTGPNESEMWYRQLIANTASLMRSTRAMALAEIDAQDNAPAPEIDGGF